MRRDPRHRPGQPGLQRQDARRRQADVAGRVRREHPDAADEIAHQALGAGDLYGFGVGALDLFGPTCGPADTTMWEFNAWQKTHLGGSRPPSSTVTATTTSRARTRAPAGSSSTTPIAARTTTSSSRTARRLLGPRPGRVRQRLVICAPTTRSTRPAPTRCDRSTSCGPTAPTTPAATHRAAATAVYGDAWIRAPPRRRSAR